VIQQQEVAERLEIFVRKQCAISPSDPGFGHHTNLFDNGYVDSLGLVEMLEFIEIEWDVAVPDEELLGDDFATIDGMARTIAKLADV
jgi:acyl carrier protein